MQIKLVGLAGWLGLGIITHSNLLHAQEATPGKDDKNAAKPILEWHHAGLDQVNQLRDLSNYRQIINLPETKPFRDAAVDKLARYSAEKFRREGAPAEKEKIAALVRPLIQSALQFEMRLELHPGADGNTKWIIGIKTPQKDLWSTNLWQLASFGPQKPVAGQINGAAGWSSSIPGKNYKVALWNQKDWTYVSGGTETVKDPDPFGKIKLFGPQPTLLQANFNFPELGKVLHNEKLSHYPSLDLTVEPRGNALRSEATLTYSRDLKLKPEPWQIPTNSIKDPLIAGQPGLIGFTAVQGTSRILSRSEKLKEIGIHQNPNQIFFWADSVSPFSLSFATQVGNPGQFLKNFAEAIMPELNEKVKRLALGSISAGTNENRISWKGLPIIVPYLTAGKGSDQRFLLGGIFPVANPSTNPAPAELFQQVTGQKNLVYYDWEITEARLAQWRPILQLLQILAGKSLKAPDSHGELWLNKVQQYLGNTITEATLAGSNSLKVVRRSDIGLNSLELALFVDWLDNPGFPGWKAIPTSGGDRVGQAPQPSNPAGQPAPAPNGPKPNPSPL
ncbi:MAG: hypothetical protein ACO1QB_14085 [Verrucomicrobiales bacterium]